ncbi:MAG: succinate dehydrogenase/fumarate reductase iron-sulfur subunit [Anaerolineae bacterium]|nr:succinate dehydrogenase/fumarate reductase iron-sulfur subunit [Anaerolineae bacterium]
MSITLTLRILRSRRDVMPHYETFEVSVSDAANVLDAIEQVWAHRDRKLMFRHACHHASCGTCAVRINGREKLPCIVPVADYSGKPLTIEPLRNFDIVGDLVVDMAKFFQNQQASDFVITRPTENELVGKPIAYTGGMDPESASTIPFNRFENCVECGICLSACPTMAGDHKFFGPAGLAAIKRQLDKTTDPVERKRLLELADGEHGVWRCHSAWECTEACPQQVFPAESIMALRKEITKKHFRELFGK